MTLSWLDTAVLVFVAIQLLLGFRQGFVVAVIGLFADLAAVAAVFLTVPAIGTWAHRQFQWPIEVVMVVAAVLWFVLARAIARRLSWSAFKALSRNRHAARADRWAGLLPGAAVGWLGAIVGVWLYGAFVGAIPPHSPVSTAVQRSGEQAVQRVSRALPGGLPGIALMPGGWTVVAGEAPGEAAPASTLEKRMWQRVNQERTKRGLKALAWDGQLAEVARAHSRDMLAKSYFAHEDPKGRTVADRAHRAGVFYLVIGENLAFAPNLAIAHEGLMESPGHRENILRPGFNRVGIGIVRIPRNSPYLPKHGGKAPPRPLRGFGDYLLVTQVFKR